MKTKLTLTDKQIDSIREYVSQRFGIYGIKDYNFEIKETPCSSYGMEIKQEIPSNGLGIFKHALTKCFFTVRVWRRNAEEQNNYCDVHLNYEHVSGGSNGCEINCNFLIHEDGKIIEKYRY